MAKLGQKANRCETVSITFVIIDEAPCPVKILGMSSIVLFY